MVIFSTFKNSKKMAKCPNHHLFSGKQFQKGQMSTLMLGSQFEKSPSFLSSSLFSRCWRTSKTLNISPDFFDFSSKLKSFSWNRRGFNKFYFFAFFISRTWKSQFKGYRYQFNPKPKLSKVFWRFFLNFQLFLRRKNSIFSYGPFFQRHNLIVKNMHAHTEHNLW